MKRAIAVLVLVLASGTVPSGATFTTSRTNPQGFGAAGDFAVHVSVNPPGAVGGSYLLKANANETAGGTITQVVFQRAAPGGSSWTTICTDTDGAPWQCTWPTSGNSQYDLRALATNNSGYTRISQTVPNVVVDNSLPSIDFSVPGQWVSGTLSLGVTNASDAGGSGFARVDYEYRTSPSGTWTDACSSTTGPGYSCTFNTSGLTNGQAYDFRATAYDGANNQSSVTVTNKSVDNAPPSGGVTYTGPANMRGTVALPTSAADGHSGVASITIQYSVAGANSWSTACIKTSSAWTCDWDTTTVTSQMYDLRVVVVDVAGNQHTSTALANQRVDNIAPATTLSVTPSGTLSGVITMTATATENSGGSGVQHVTLQYSTAGANAWGTACGPLPPPTYTCSPSSTAVADGLYDFRAVSLDYAGNTGEALDLNRRIDNLTPSASDVQTTDVGGTPGVIQVGDSLTLTYSEAIDPTSLIAAWNGQTQPTIYARLTHHNQGDRFLFYTTAALTTAIPLAGAPGVVLDADFVSSNTTLPATLTRSADGKSFTIAFTSVPGVSTTPAAAAMMRWTPAAGAKDMVGKASTTTARDESGSPLDRDF
ncbi:MAG: hypothetical protein M3389_04935 [Actinomycetota bacterium]|nr:hypothetical protein [Actinomycetota bacterium]